MKAYKVVYSLTTLKGKKKKFEREFFTKEVAELAHTAVGTKLTNGDLITKVVAVNIDK